MDQNPIDLEKLYEDYFPKIYNYIFYRLLQKEETEDLVSQIFLKIAEHIGSYDPQKAKLSTWIYSIAANSFTDYCRTHRASVSLEDEGTSLALTVDFETQYDEVLDTKRKLLLTALRQMSQRDRLLLYSAYFLEMSYREISRQMNLNESTMASALMRAKIKLRRLLESGGQNEQLR